MTLSIGKKTRLRNNRRAVTLIEILVVLIVLVVIAGLTIPNFSRSYQRFQLENTANRLMHVMRYAQSRSITKGAKHRLNFGNDWENYWLTQSRAEPNSKSEEGDFDKIASRWGRTFKIPEEISVESKKEYVEFDTDGEIEKTRIYLCRADDCWTVSTQEQRGYVQLFDARLN